MISSILKATSKQQTVVLDTRNVDEYNSLSYLYNISNSLVLNTLLSRLHHHPNYTQHSMLNIHSKSIPTTHTHSTNTNTNTNNTNTNTNINTNNTTGIKGDNMTLVTPLHMFVASDDSTVLKAASGLNYMTLSGGGE